MNEALISEDEIKNLLLVEGQDDAYVCAHLLKCYGIRVRDPLTKGPLVKGEIDIKDRKGIENLLGTLKADLKGSEPRRLGILVDADQNLDTRWQSFVTILKEFYGIVPTHPSPEGTIIKEEGRLPVGIWLMPDNRLPGMLEHFCSFMVPSDDVLWPIADNVLLEVVKQDRRLCHNTTVSRTTSALCPGIRGNC
ncbi:MAG TPA: DUF3226 domain-containing protein [Ktedonosporobacter sp.]|jgi:hypothetical protein|nr:DUF3226 domain-containing protein [Ktedonosporobacter sp.]